MSWPNVACALSPSSLQLYGKHFLEIVAFLIVNTLTMVYAAFEGKVLLRVCLGTYLCAHTSCWQWHRLMAQFRSSDLISQCMIYQDLR